ncbi:hypothetical protein PtrSN002B_000373 [Pyrenophora tritici-repentis]|uniref:Uncharacterized protein n=1 Tax=Pyrenophora tritici-repentis TaxID=45151 RepID=A0A2W1DR67_9PLEO|nr:hypothetical protein PtrV1_05468 [Pyrenophora tritici-repentis]KAF7572784.1 hypothetical protein PtrM4_076890 [Pyrenophora tritici-repentis]KAI0588111.1 hypothetical protein Alg215_01027 [Pyrenophora tritici-repentis]KAI0592082.1 hypothetical protein Alg130_00683 [Pyrenophora tritici-repentis]KAI0614252.1 hypothetical protein TUN205_01545 [Pyrenophora tritici-repentis]
MDEFSNHAFAQRFDGSNFVSYTNHGSIREFIKSLVDEYATPRYTKTPMSGPTIYLSYLLEGVVGRKKNTLRTYIAPGDKTSQQEAKHSKHRLHWYKLNLAPGMHATEGTGAASRVTMPP